MDINRYLQFRIYRCRTGGLTQHRTLCRVYQRCAEKEKRTLLLGRESRWVIIIFESETSSCMQSWVTEIARWLFSFKGQLSSCWHYSLFLPSYLWISMPRWATYYYHYVYEFLLCGVFFIFSEIPRLQEGKGI